MDFLLILRLWTTPKDSSANYPKDDLAEIPASIPINEGYNCIHKSSRSNQSHAIIEGDTNPIEKKLSKAIINVFQF